MIALYHGSNCDVRRPVPSRGRRGTDFGQGFYLTPDMDSARSMASLVVAREGSGSRTINVFEFNDEAALDVGLRIRRFDVLDMDWVSFVLANRCFDRSAPILVSLGSESTAVVQPKDIFAEALKVGADAVVIAHNHPSGDLTPSIQDRALTDAVSRLGDSLGIKLVDHLVLT